MSTECKGILGKVFGHKFRSMLVKEHQPGKLEVMGPDTIKILDEMKQRDYKLVCVRCGKEFEDDQEEEQEFDQWAYDSLFELYRHSLKELSEHKKKLRDYGIS